ncbi:hypothetical protein CERSUDRAFT_132491, partial [Gelatoporia subvermispora B]
IRFLLGCRHLSYRLYEVYATEGICSISHISRRTREVCTRFPQLSPHEDNVSLIPIDLHLRGLRLRNASRLHNRNCYDTSIIQLSNWIQRVRYFPKVQRSCIC